MAKRATPAKTVAPKIIDIGKTKQEGLALVSPLTSSVVAIDVTDDESYLEADKLLGKIGDARKVWAGKMEPIIRPIRQGLDNLYALNREVDRPLEQLEKSIKAKMIDYKTEERRLLREAEDRRIAEENRLRREAEAKEAAAKAAVTPQLRGRLQAQAERLTEAANTVAEEEIPAPLQADRSSERAPEKARVGDLGHFIQAILDGTIPEEMITVNQVVLNRKWKDEPETVRAWPGVEIYEDIQIVRR